jgi:hypothetical protein
VWNAQACKMAEQKTDGKLAAVAWLHLAVQCDPTMTEPFYWDCTARATDRQERTFEQTTSAGASRLCYRRRKCPWQPLQLWKPNDAKEVLG